MNKTGFKSIVLGLTLLGLALQACAPGGSPSRGSRAGLAAGGELDDVNPPDWDPVKGESPAASLPEPVQTSIRVPRGSLNRQGRPAESIRELSREQQERAAPLLFTEQRQVAVPVYELPQSLRRRAEEQNLNLAPAQSTQFSIFNPHTNVNVNTSKMTFTGVLRIASRNQQSRDQQIRLECGFDKNATLWQCEDMKPPVPTVSQYEMIGSAVCLDIYRCDEMGVRIYIKMNGKWESRHFQTPPKIREVISGDGPEHAEGAAHEGEDADANPVAGSNTEPAAEPTEEVDPPSTLPPSRPAQPTQPAQQAWKPSKRPQLRPTANWPPPGQVPQPQVDPQAPAPANGAVDSQPDQGAALPAGQDAPRSGNAATPQLPGAPPVDEAPSAPELPPEPREFTPDEAEQIAQQDRNALFLVDTPIEPEVPQVVEQAEEEQRRLTDVRPTARPESVEAAARARLEADFEILQISLVWPRVQAKGIHQSGSLVNSVAMPSEGVGYRIKGSSQGQTYGTTMTINLLKAVFESMARKRPDAPPIVLGDISDENGGQLDGHGSHKNGLDADIGFAFESEQSGFTDAVSAASELDKERAWELMKQLNCAEVDSVLAIFISSTLKEKFCKFARDRGEDISDRTKCGFKTLQKLYHEPGHRDHIHVRFRCPPNIDRNICRAQEIIQFDNGNGC